MLEIIDISFTNTLFALLSVVVLFGAAALIFINIVRKLAPSATWAGRACEAVRGQAAVLVAVATGGAMAGSLYYSEVVGYPPCTLCWYQRIAMYSLVIISTVAAVRKTSDTLRPYGLALAVPGFLISAYHTWLQAFPRVTTFCSADAPCSERHVWEFGFVSIPFMAATVFLFAIVALLTGKTRSDG